MSCIDVVQVGLIDSAESAEIDLIFDSVEDHATTRHTVHESPAKPTRGAAMQPACFTPRAPSSAKQTSTRIRSMSAQHATPEQRVALSKKAFNRTALDPVAHFENSSYVQLPEPTAVERQLDAGWSAVGFLHLIKAEGEGALAGCCPERSGVAFNSFGESRWRSL